MKKTILINAFITLLILAVLEGGARIYIWHATGTSTAGLPEKKRNLQYQAFTMWGVDLDKKVSSYKPPTDNTYRIVIVGGSTARSFPSYILEAAFQQRYPENKFEVINLAYSGYNARQEVIVASIWGINLKPDMLLSITGGNDIRHRVHMEKAGTFYLDPAYRLILTRPFITPIVEILRNSQLKNGIERLMARKEMLPLTSYEDAIPIFIDAQHSLNLLANGACIERIMVLQPFKPFKNPLSEKEASFTRYEYRKNVVMELYNQANSSLESLAKTDGVMYLDGRNIYDNIEDTIFTDDVHFKDSTGYEILADNIVGLTNKQQLNTKSGCN